MDETTAGDSGGPKTTGDGQARRRARTHSALVAAGRELLSRGAVTASIDEITSLAGVGFGSFANHFPEGKAAFFHEVALGVLSDLGTEIGRATDAQTDPARAVAIGFRTTARLARAQPALRSVLLRPGTEVLFVADTLLAAAQHDIDRGIAEGSFIDADARLLLVSVGGVLIASLRLLGARDEGTASATTTGSDAEIIDDACAAALRLLGVETDRAHAIAHEALPRLSHDISPQP